MILKKLKTYKFPLDGKTFTTRNGLITHIEMNYKNLLVPDKYGDEMTPGRLYFNIKYNKQFGRCVISGKPTKWNEATQRYERFYSEKEAKQYRDEFIARMKNKYGKEHLLDDPDRQKIMLSSRGTTSKYTWKNNRTTEIISKNEGDFLSMLEHTYHFDQTMITEAPTIDYEYEGKSHFYMPDFYIPSLNLIVEIKASNNGYQKDKIPKEKAKSFATKAKGFNFIQINDNNFTDFHLFLIESIQNT